MLIAAALCALAPFSIVAGEPVFSMFNRTMLHPRYSRKSASNAANDAPLGTQMQSAPNCPAEAATERPIDRIRLPRKPAAIRRRTTTAAAPASFVSVQRCRAQAANDGSVKMYWASPAVHDKRGICWAMTGRIADICAELERLERLELQHALG